MQTGYKMHLIVNIKFEGEPDLPVAGANPAKIFSQDLVAHGGLKENVFWLCKFTGNFSHSIIHTKYYYLKIIFNLHAHRSSNRWTKRNNFWWKKELV